ncbi:recombinase family protein [Amycolatopsis sp. cmx-11-32]|uniref:recombinase family protein n=1 Tax=Amycolatopsis sp. cmx-11-32 TaxID=2785796 RepID=UPI0039E5F012
MAAQLDEGGYHDATGTDPALMAPAIARHAITAFTRPGDVVLDPDCGAGTTIVEALRSGRHAIGLTGQRRWWRLARTNVTATKAGGVFVDGMVLVLDRRPGTAVAAATAGLTGRVDLLLTTLRPAGSNGDVDGALDRLRSLLSQYRPLVRPGGHVVITCAPQRHSIRHDLLDVPSQIAEIGSASELAPIARCLALTAAVRRRRAYTRATLAQRRAAGRAERALGHPIALPAHHTVLVFRADPEASDPALTQLTPALPVPQRPNRRLAKHGWHRPPPEHTFTHSSGAQPAIAATRAGMHKPQPASAACRPPPTRCKERTVMTTTPERSDSPRRTSRRDDPALYPFLKNRAREPETPRLWRRMREGLADFLTAPYEDDDWHMNGYLAVRGYQRELVRRSRSALRQRTRDGWWLGPAPYGYTLEHHWVEAETGRGGWRHRLIVDELRAPVVALIFAWYLYDKLSERDMVRLLTEQEHPRPADPVSGRLRAWSPGAVRTILNNPVYLGYVVRGRTLRGVDQPPECWTWSQQRRHQVLVEPAVYWAVYNSRFRWGPVQPETDVGREAA